MNLMKRAEFKISDTQLKQFAQELLMFGQQHKLEPHELAIVLNMVSDFIAKFVGLQSIETKVTTEETP
jgi:hypothetical protein